MYGETGGLIRSELTALLQQHRVQQRLGGPGLHTVPITSTHEERREMGLLIRRYRQATLIWCHQATVAITPYAVSNLQATLTNPFQNPKPSTSPLAALRGQLTHAIAKSSATLPGLEELTTPHPEPLVEHWRHVARAAALGEHDFAPDLSTGLGHGRLSAQQAQTVAGDIAAVTQALVVLDRRYGRVPGWERLVQVDRLGWAALATALDAHLEPPDYSVDLRGWQPPTKLMTGPAKPGFLGVLQAEHNLVVRMKTFPNALNLRLIADSQRLLAAGLAKLAEPIDATLAQKWATREQTYIALQRDLRDVGGRLGKGHLAVAEGATAVSRLQKLSPDAPVEARVLHGFENLFNRLDARVADIVEHGVTRHAYFLRIKAPTVLDHEDGSLIVPARERYIPLSDAGDLPLLHLVRTQLRPLRAPVRPPAGAARSRAELHAGVIHRPPSRGAMPDAPSI